MQSAQVLLLRILIPPALLILLRTLPAILLISALALLLLLIEHTSPAYGAERTEVGQQPSSDRAAGTGETPLSHSANTLLGGSSRTAGEFTETERERETETETERERERDAVRGRGRGTGSSHRRNNGAGGGGGGNAESRREDNEVRGEQGRRQENCDMSRVGPAAVSLEVRCSWQE